jgi:hypothetical protein
MLGEPNANAAKNADKMLRELLSTHGLTWNDLTAIIAEAERLIAEKDAEKRRGEAAARYAGPQTGAKASATDAPEINVLDLVLRLIELHVGLTAEQRMAGALWAMHSHVFGRFPITPRLALLSPVRGCGKTLLLILLELFTADPYRSDNVSAAALYHELAHRERTLLLDEGDNLGLLNNPVLRAGVQRWTSAGRRHLSFRRRPVAEISGLCATRSCRDRHLTAADHAPRRHDPYAAPRPGRRRPTTAQRVRSHISGSAQRNRQVGGDLLARPQP